MRMCKAHDLYPVEVLWLHDPCVFEHLLQHHQLLRMLLSQLCCQAWQRLRWGKGTATASVRRAAAALWRLRLL